MSAISSDERRVADVGLQPTTIFDYLYRLRCRCDYQDTEMFALGALTEDDSKVFLAAASSVVGYCLCFLESVLCGRIGEIAVRAIVDEDVERARLECFYLPVELRWRREVEVDDPPF